MKTLGLIAAGGRADRFEGVLKELLPLPSGKTLLENAIDTLSFCDLVVVLSNSYKAVVHAYQTNKYKNVCLWVRDTLTLWDAIRMTFLFEAEKTYFIMPDTKISHIGFPETSHFEMGIFKTDKPERFGVVYDGIVIDKSRGLSGVFDAWGALMWDKEVSDFWKTHIYGNYTDAINDAILRFGFNYYPITEYRDFASIEDYKELFK